MQFNPNISMQFNPLDTILT